VLARVPEGERRDHQRWAQLGYAWETTARSISLRNAPGKAPETGQHRRFSGLSDKRFELSFAKACSDTGPAIWTSMPRMTRW